MKDIAQFTDIGQVHRLENKHKQGSEGEHKRPAGARAVDGIEPFASDVLRVVPPYSDVAPEVNLQSQATTNHY
jgi:hypothetical protein